MAEMPPRPKYFDIDRFARFTNPYSESPRTRAKLTVTFREDLFLFTCYTNDPQADRNDKAKQLEGIISFPLSLERLKMFKQDFELIAKGPSDKRMKLEHYRRAANEPTSPLELSSELWWGKDKDGICWMSVTGPNRAKIKFPIQMGNNYKRYKSDGTLASPEETSVFETLAILEILERAYEFVLFHKALGHVVAIIGVHSQANLPDSIPLPDASNVQMGDPDFPDLPF